MKKLLALSLVLSLFGVTAAFADEPTTYTEYLLQKHSQKLVDKEKELQQQQKAREEARQKQQEAFQQKIEAHQRRPFRRQVGHSGRLRRRRG